MRDTEPLNLPQELVFGVKISPFSLSLNLFRMARDTLFQILPLSCLNVVPNSNARELERTKLSLSLSPGHWPVWSGCPRVRCSTL